MPKVNNIVMKETQGSLQGLTFVKSRRYGSHVRSRRGSIKPAPVNSALKECSEKLQKANVPAKLIFGAFRSEHKDGGTWSRLLSIFNKQIKSGLQPSVSCMENFECSEERTLDTLIFGGDYAVTVLPKEGQLEIDVEMKKHPVWKANKSVDGYQVSILVIFPDFNADKIEKPVVSGPIASFNDQLATYHFEVPVAEWAKEYAVFLKVTAAFRGRVENGQTTQGMRVVKAGTL